MEPAHAPTQASSFLYQIARVPTHTRTGHVYVQDPLVPINADSKKNVRMWIISAPCGRGKSQLFRRVVRTRFSTDARILSITPRVSLAVAQASLLQGLGFVSYNTMKNVADELSSEPRCICEYESLHYMDEAALSSPYDLVVCDEIRSTICSASSTSTNGTNVVTNASAFTRILQLAKHVLFMDADVESDGAVARLIRDVFKDAPRCIQYEMYPPLNLDGNVRNVSSREPRRLVMTSRPSFLWQSIVKALRCNERVAVVCALRRQALAYAEACVQEKLLRPGEIGCYTSDMSEEEVTRVFSDFDKATQDKRIVLFTSKVSVGIDASVTRPHRIFMDFFYPVQVARVALQMLYRFRRPLDGTTLCLIPAPLHPLSSTDVSMSRILWEERESARTLRDEMQARERPLTMTGSSQDPPPEFLRVCMYTTRSERKRDFVADLWRLARTKGILCSKTNEAVERDLDATYIRWLSKAQNRVRTRDREFASQVTLTVLRASRTRDALRRIVEDTQTSTRASRALEAGSNAFLCHSVGNRRQASAENGRCSAIFDVLLGPAGSSAWDRLDGCGRFRDVSKCAVLSDEGTRVKRIAYLPATPDICVSMRSACDHLYRETLAAYASGRSQRLSALLNACAVGSESAHEVNSRIMRKMISTDMSANVQYGSACISRSEIGVFRSCNRLAQHYLGIQGGLATLARMYRQSKRDSAAAPPLVYVPVRFRDSFVGTDGESERQACAMLARTTVVLAQNIQANRNYQHTSKFDGTSGGPRYTAIHAYTAPDTVRFVSSVLYFTYGILLLPRASARAVLKRYPRGTWNVCSPREDLWSEPHPPGKSSLFVALIDHVRWSLAETFVASGAEGGARGAMSQKQKKNDYDECKCETVKKIS